MFTGITKDNHHHAYLLEGDRESVLPELFTFLERELGIKRIGNPDVTIWDGDSLSIDDAREMRTKDRTSAFLGGKKIFVIATGTIGHEAQNALLKTLEEPSRETMIFLVVATKQVLLPTVRSRMQHLRLAASATHGNGNDAARQFLEGDMRSRMLLVKDIVEEKEKEKAKAFVDEIVTLYHESGRVEAGFALALLDAKKYLFDRSASVKLILEHLALTAPLISKRGKS